MERRYPGAYLNHQQLVLKSNRITGADFASILVTRCAHTHKLLAAAGRNRSAQISVLQRHWGHADKQRGDQPLLQPIHVPGTLSTACAAAIPTIRMLTPRCALQDQTLPFVLQGSVRLLLLLHSCLAMSAGSPNMLRCR